MDGTNRTLERLIMQNLSWLSRTKRKLSRSVIGLAQAGLVLWLLTLPLVLARFHVLSLAALVLNVLLWPLMSVSLLSGFGVLLFGTVFPPLGWLCGWLCDASFWLLEGGVNLGHRMPCGHFWVPGPADWWLWGFYGALGFGAGLSADSAAAALVRGAAGRVDRGGLCGLGLAARSQPPRLHVSQRGPRLRGVRRVSLGPDDALRRRPDGRAVVGRARTISEFLWDRGLTHLDAVVLSHPDIDHYNALPELLEKFSVGAVYVSPVMFEKENRTIAALRDAIDRHGVPVREVRAGDRLRPATIVWSRCCIRRGAASSVPDNANSLVLAVEYRGRRIVLPGDLESPGLDDMLAEEPRPCEVLMAPHHGSRKSNSPGLAAWCKPRWVVFSGDGRWNLPEIDSTYRAVGGQTLHTYNCGAIRVRIDGDGVQVSQFVESK